MTLKIPEMTFADSVFTSILGFAIVFVVLVMLMVMIQVMRSVVGQMAAKTAAPAAPVAAAAAAPAAPATNMIPAKGSLGEVKLFNVDDTTAALIMAIVADEMDAPLNELRFHSIREKK